MDQVLQALKNIEVKPIIDIRKKQFKNLSKEEFQEVRNILIGLGAEEIQELRYIHNETHQAEFNYNGVLMVAWVTVEKSREEKIAELQKQLAELEGDK